MDALDFEELIKSYPWIVRENQNCIISPDSDGMLCGLLLSHYLGWKIQGFYDGKILIKNKDIQTKDCVFLDMEIFRNGVKSIGQHLVLYDKRRLPPNWDSFKNCISANNLRRYDFKENFSKKYPFGTIHLLLAILGKTREINIPKESLAILLYTDGTFKNLFNYPENCLSWLKFLGANNEGDILHQVFFHDHFTVSSLMKALAELFEELKTINNGRRGADKIKISDKDGLLINFDEETASLKTETIQLAEKFLQVLSEKTGWGYKKSDWQWNNLEVVSFEKGMTAPTLGKYNELMAKNPLSLAITASTRIEYTLDPKKLFR